MTALVERGAPRDFLDIYTLCQKGLVTKEQCWELWRQRQEVVRNDTDLIRAKAAVQLHLERIIQHRPLKNIPDGTTREKAAQVRRWFETEFTNVYIGK